MKKKLFLSGMIFLLLLPVSDTFAQNRDWSIVASYTVPGKASGLAWDGTFLYYGIYGANGDHFYKFDPATGTASVLFINPAIDDSYGMTYDGTHLWIIDQPASSSQPALATKLDMTGNIISTIPLPDHYMSGIAWDDGDFWVNTYYPDPGTTYKVDNTGSPLSQFVPPADQPWDICLEGADLWIADYNANMLYKVDVTGTILEQHPSENIKPAGIVFDGIYLWYVDGQLSSNSTLYKVDLGGAGTPAINIPQRSHDYGTVTTGTSETWDMEVQNTGTADLSITGIVIPSGQPISTTFTPPLVIQPGHSADIPITYAPLQPGTLNTSITVQSSDPITPNLDVALLGEAVNPGPSIVITQSTHDYGLVRMNAYTRWFLEIKNIGSESLSITEINSSIPEFIVEQETVFPIELLPLETAEIGIWFHPVQGSYYNGELEIVNNDLAHNPTMVFLEGEGNDAQWPIGEALWYYYIDESFDNSPKAIHPVKDITGDGVDEVVVCSEDNNIRCFNGNSSGMADVMWTTNVYSGNVAYQNDITVIPDINGDGYEDVIVGTTGGDRSVIALSGKKGSVLWKFLTSSWGGEGGWVFQVDASYDYNGDAFPDVLAAVSDGDGSGPARVFAIDGKTGDDIWDCYTGGPNFSVIGVKDFNGDNIPDAVAGASDAGELQGYVYGINGADGNIEWTFEAGGSSVWALGQLSDINGKGVQDIIAGDFGGNYYFLDAEDGAELYSGSLGFSNIITRFARLDDVNGDALPDFTPGYSGTNATVINGQDASNIWFQSLSDKSWNVARISDVSGDGINDVIVGTLFTNNYCYFLNGTDGEVLESINYSEPVDAINSIPDITGDHSMEMVAGGRYGKIFCYSGGLNSAVGINEKPAIGNIKAHAFPNPLNTDEGSPLIIEYTLQESGKTVIRILNSLGMDIGTLHEAEESAGVQRIPADLSGLSGGIYFISIQHGNSLTTLKITIH
ncbi:MAG: choice-of-anchor D domain-containing protein [Bacteroidetes bacterium]|nr:choice-of-anchor D domain-containing protein [Bacteroidota bacterium]